MPGRSCVGPLPLASLHRIWGEHTRASTGYPSNWGLAPATAVLLIATGLKHAGMEKELRLVLLRAAEVLAGGATAVAVALGFDQVARLRSDR